MVPGTLTLRYILIVTVLLAILVPALSPALAAGAGSGGGGGGGPVTPGGFGDGNGSRPTATTTPPPTTLTPTPVPTTPTPVPTTTPFPTSTPVPATTTPPVPTTTTPVPTSTPVPSTPDAASLDGSPAPAQIPVSATPAPSLNASLSSGREEGTGGQREWLLPAALFLFGAGLLSLWLFHRKASRRGEDSQAEPTLVLSPVNDPRALATALSDKYTDITLVATGGLSRVYRARRREDGRTVALKIPLDVRESTGASFLKEMLAWQNVAHPNIVQITRVTILPFPMVEMEYLEHSLADIRKPVDPVMAVRIIHGVAEGLAYAHGKGIVHRDIKPENILLAADGTPRITDWGMSRISSAADMPTITGFTLSYAAPEQVAPPLFGPTDERTDIFQLGVVFYELVTGELPFKGEGIAEITEAILQENPLTPSEIVKEAEPLNDIILTCLRKDPRLRYQSAREILAALDHLA
jgi:eukaryotic-like serine/threonine-protein kinase